MTNQSRSYVDAILPRERFEEIMASEFAAAAHEPKEEWLKYAKQVLDADLAEHMSTDCTPIEYGDPDHSWDEEAAREVALIDIGYWEVSE